jgi:hypothetical protein
MATCTISASASSGPDGGCFIARLDNSELKPYNLRLKPEKGVQTTVKIIPWSSEQDNFHLGPLSKRGWCFQERELSRRIIHFTNKRVHWECRSAVASEDYPTMNLLWRQKFLASPLQAQRLLPRLDFDSVNVTRNVTRPSTTKHWPEIVQAYSNRNFTYRTDKLPAMFGLASIVYPLVTSQYLGGIWLCDFAREASWFLSPTARIKPTVDSPWPPPTPADLQAPSWSWASVDGPIVYPPSITEFDSGGALNSNASHINWPGIHDKMPTSFALQVHGFTGSVDVFGRSSNSTLFVEGAVMKIKLSESAYISDFLRDSPLMPEFPKCYRIFGGYLMTTFSKASVEDGIVYFDHDPTRLPKMEFSLLQLGRGRSRFVPETVYMGLVLLQGSVDMDMDIPNVPGDQVLNYAKCRRVGMFEVGHRNKKYSKKTQIGPVSLI